MSKTGDDAAKSIAEHYGAGWRLQLLTSVVSCVLVLGIVADIVPLVVVAMCTLIAITPALVRTR